MTETVLKPTKSQREALNAVLLGLNVCILGHAGTGKSTLICAVRNALQRNHKRALFCAPTGRAALNIMGKTMHSLFRIPRKVLPPWLAACTNVETLAEYDAVVIDELGMVRRDCFGFIVRCIEKADEVRVKRGLRPIQIIGVGDFTQLEPVLTRKEQKTFEQMYGPTGERYAFNAIEWDRCGFKVCVLKESVRLVDSEEVRLTRTLAMGYSHYQDHNVIAEVAALCQHDECEQWAYLYCRRKDADTKNEEFLDRLETEEMVYKAKRSGVNKKRPDLFRADELRIKTGARVMVIDNIYEGAKNGSLGTVTGWNEGTIFVHFDGDSFTEPIERERWYYDSECDDWEKATPYAVATDAYYEQFPLALGWAMTIHKSQGLTLPGVNLDPTCFACGQLVTGLTRTKHLGNIHLLSEMKEEYLITSREAVRFVNQAYYAA